MSRTVLLSQTILAIVIFAVPDSLFGADRPHHDLSKEKVLYCVSYAHLDTQWRWDFATTINDYIRNTMEQNFSRFDKYPGYVFNFTGSARYAMMKEYYPAKFEQLK